MSTKTRDPYKKNITSKLHHNTDKNLLLVFRMSQKLLFTFTLYTEMFCNGFCKGHLVKCYFNLLILLETQHSFSTIWQNFLIFPQKVHRKIRSRQ